MVIQVVVGLVVLCLAYGVGAPGTVRQPGVALLRRAGFGVLTYQPFICVQVEGGYAVGCLADPAVKGVIAVGCCLSVGQCYPGQPVGSIVAVLCGAVVFGFG